MKYPNYYESVQEARMRLNKTIILYDGKPFYVMGVAGHNDGKFRIYMKPLGDGYLKHLPPGIMPPNELIPPDYPGFGEQMDKFMKEHPAFGMIRKHLDSPLFNRFRPFPLGMMNYTERDEDGKLVAAETFYLERQPGRRTEQGLVRAMIFASSVNAARARLKQAQFTFDTWSEEFKDCIEGNYPSVDLCLSKLRDPKIANEAVAFHRYFAFVRGPCDMIFLSYKGEIIGVLPRQDLSAARLSREARHTLEAVEELKIFNTVEGR
jgi:hypothetical protein